MIDKEYGFLAHVAFGIIAVLALIGNVLICVVILRRKRLLNKPCNILILNLAATDLLTGNAVLPSSRPTNFLFNPALFLVVTPDFVLPHRLFAVPENTAGELFCRLIASTYVLFTFGKASSLTVMCMAVERWYAIVKPMKYKVTFRKRRLGLYIMIVWIFSCFTQINELFQKTSKDGLCRLTDPPYGIQTSQILTLFHIAMTFYIPSIVTWMTFTDVWLSMRKNRKISAHCVMTSYGVAKRRIVRMCAITAFVLTLCWFPAETFYILLTFKKLVLPFGFYQFTIVLAMFNSCVNPVVYCLSNQEYRKDFIALFHHYDRVEILGLRITVIESQSVFRRTANLLTMKINSVSTVVHLTTVQ
ncbi:hypothetical protein QZH41_015809 [Actinostola sp. cb2023]|nr:hypothetical protein QZH41_015809 [Actinostola sp. cb2023]